MKKQLTTALMIIMMSVQSAPLHASGSLRSKPPESAAEAPKSSACEKCDKALGDQVQLNHSRQRLIKAQDEHILTQRKKIEQLTEANNSIFRSPWLWLGVGLVTGVVITK